GKVVERDVEDAGHEALHPELPAQAAFFDRAPDPGVDAGGRDTFQHGRVERDVDRHERRAPVDLDVRHVADPDAAHHDRRPLLEAGDGGVEVHYVAILGPEQTGAAPEQEASHEHDRGAEDERTDDGRIRAHTHTAAPPAAVPAAPR